jgi:hypothetical protein
MPVGEMLKRISSRELTEWQAYFSVKAEAAQPKAPDARTGLQAMFGGRVKKKSKE